MADQDQYVFDKNGTRRAVNAIRYVEQINRNPRPHRPYQPMVVDSGRWAKITENGQDGKYSWVAVRKKDNGEWEEKPDWGRGDYRQPTGYAMEARYKSKWVLKDSIVWITPVVGYDFWEFDYEPGVWLAKIVSAGSISARSGSQAGSGSVTIQESDDSGSITDKEDITVFNNSTSEITGEEGADNELNLWIGFGTGGLWWVTGVDCPAEEESTGGS